ncbi:hypothetical protein COLINT_01958 [Collinsella intestinalis DSM 13280]|uniref:Uncharacterized protein n=1 Tax=Collinsella intestinalis DSM 13280 TaxID=521003 RepID=C4F7E3_9ACTN|nr:hypothetical protein COLINT_01958 [Collinsella intestinalis DSM 13280]
MRPCRHGSIAAIAARTSIQLRRDGGWRPCVRYAWGLIVQSEGVKAVRGRRHGAIGVC